MNPPAIIPFPAAGPAQAAAARVVDRPAPLTFPWLLLLGTWGAFFPLQNWTDAPERWLTEPSLTQLVTEAQDGSSFAPLLIISLSLLGTFLLFRHRDRIRIQQTFAILFGSYIGWTLLSGSWAGDQVLAVRRLVSMALYVVFEAGCVTRTDAVSLTAFCAAIPLLNLLPGMFLEFKLSTFRPWESGYRFVGSAVHPNVQAATLSVSLIFSVWLAMGSRGSKRRGWIAAAVLGFAFLVLTGSRTSLLGVMAAFAFSALLYLLRDFRRWLPLTVALIIVAAGTLALANFVFLSTEGGKDISSSLQSHGDDDNVTSLNGRTELWQQLWGYALQRPITGYGFGSFWIPDRIEYISKEQGWVIQQAHSAYIEQLLGLGFPGVALYLSLLLGGFGFLVYRFFRGYSIYGAWAALFLFFFIHNFTEAINVSGGGFNLFVFNLVLLHISLIAPATLEGTAVPAAVIAGSQQQPFVDGPATC